MVGDLLPKVSPNRDPGLIANGDCELALDDGPDLLVGMIVLMDGAAVHSSSALRLARRQAHLAQTWPTI